MIGKRLTLVLGLVFLVVSGCNPKVQSRFSVSYPTLDYDEDVVVLAKGTELPKGSEKLGFGKIGDTGFSTNCSYQTVVQKAIFEARKAGGNTIVITEHLEPSVMGSSCHRIQFAIYRLENPEMYLAKTPEADAAEIRNPKLHVYWSDSTNISKGYNLYLNDVLLCHVAKDTAIIIDLTERGLHHFYAKTEVMAKTPIRIEPESTYYLRCGLDRSQKKEKPKLELVIPATGQVEFESMQP